MVLLFLPILFLELENINFITEKLEKSNLDNCDIVVDKDIKSEVLLNSIFAVSKSGGSNQTINHGSSTKVTFSHEITDPSSAFASDKFTVPSGKDGTYLFAWNLQIEDSDSAIVRMSTNLYKNGSVISSGQMRSEGGDTVFANYTISQTRIVPAAAADYFEVYIYQESSNGSSVILEASTSHNQFFSGTKLLT